MAGRSGEGTFIGTNKRYADRIDARRDERITEILMRDDTPESLTSEELELDKQPLTRTPQALPALAWVRYGKVAVRIPVEVVAWTPRACAVRWTTPLGREDRAWVWSSAVDQR